MSSFRRMYGLILQELFITKRSFEIFMDILFFPFMNIILFGLITVFVAAIQDATSAQYLILGVLLWQIISINQYNVTVSSLWSVWSHSLTNLFIAPISVRDYLTAHVAAALIRTVGVVALLAVGTFWLFDFNILDIGLVNLVFATINLSVFAWWIGIVLLGLIFRYGTRIQAVAWGVIFLFQPLTASFFPASVLPGAFQAIAFTQPATYVFEAARDALASGGIAWRYMAIAFVLNLAYLGLSVFVFMHFFRRSKETGQFARNDL